MKYKILSGYILGFIFSINTTAQEVSNNGYVVFYHPNSKISSEGMMLNGKPEGYWKTYDISGVLLSE